MNNIIKNISLIILLNFIYFVGLGQTIDSILVLPGKGIIFNGDSILLYKTNIKETCKILDIQDETDSKVIILSHWDGFDEETGESVSGTELIRKVKFKTIEFEFTSKNDIKNLKLRWITIGKEKTLKVYTDNGLNLGIINPNLSEFYPPVNSNDYVSENKLTYNLYSYGISMQLKQLENKELNLIEISTHYRLK